MTIEQHAEAAAEDLRKRYSGEGPDCQDVIETHMQSAIDEATEKQMSWIAVLNSEIARLEAEVVHANTERVRTQEAYQKTDSEVVQTLGKALHYPWFKDDQKNFPGATEEDGVDVGDHVSESLAAEAAKRIAELEGLGPLIEEYGSASWNDGYNATEGQRRSFASGDVKAKITAILKGGGS